MTAPAKTNTPDLFSLFARIAVALSFLSAVADRLGWWTPVLGADNVTWGNMDNFTAYTGILIPWLPQALLPFAAWAATIAEIALGVLLIIGYQKRLVALCSGLLLMTFALSMLFFGGVKSPLDYSVFSAAACCFLLYKYDR